MERDARGRWNWSVRDAVGGGGFVVWMERGTPEEGGIGPGRDYVGGYY